MTVDTLTLTPTEQTFTNYSGVQLTVMAFEGEGVALRTNNGKLYNPCRRCGGAGHYSFNLLDGTVCYGCNGSGVNGQTTEADVIRKAKQRAKSREARERKEQRRLAKQEQERAAWAAANAELDAALAEIHANPEGVGAFLNDIASKSRWQPLSERQTAAAERAVEQRRNFLAAVEAKKQQQRAAGHFGTVGEKIEAEVTLVSARFFAGDWNRSNSYLVTMTTSEGHTLKTWSSGRFGDEAFELIEKGETAVKIKGTVKKHDTYNDAPETLLSRVTLAK